jgi:N-acetylglucosaminyl-diphospho-decaprenol L-rhamnosyltransferase
MSAVDVVVVSYNSREHLRTCVEPLAAIDGVKPIVVDNASADGSAQTIADLPVVSLPRADNGGFAKGCNEGWRAGSAPLVLFLNPDATIDARSLERLVQVLDDDERVGAVAPKIVYPDGSITFSQRRFPRLRSTYARAVFLHRVAPRATWTDEIVRDERKYDRPRSAEWVSGACVMVRRSALEELGGWDEDFFLYSEDIDLCRRMWRSGRKVRFEPGAVAIHEGGASAPSATTLPYLASSRIKYARKHHSGPYVALSRLGLGLEAALRVLASRGGLGARLAHLRSLALLGSISWFSHGFTL